LDAQYEFRSACGRLIPMYCEEEDFIEHKNEMDGMLSVLARHALGVENAVILDLGAGQGMHAGFLSVHATRVYCADVVNYTTLYGGEFLKLLEEKHRRNGYSIELVKIEFNRTDARDLLYRDSFFDLVVSINSFEHIPDPSRALYEMARVTKSGGHIYISADPVWTADTGSHFFHRVPEPWGHLIYSDEQFSQKMLANGATAEEVGEYRVAMNRLPIARYLALLDQVVHRGTLRLLQADSWSGVQDELHKTHDNLRRLKEDGYEEADLLTRGIRWLFRKA
jgi:ubiquinone/menaquinone biosynthesis C-methylase UbiE